MSVSRPKIHPALFLALLLVAVFAVDRVTAATLKALVRASDYRISRIYADEAKTDVLLLGNSVANAMAIPPHIAHDVHRSVFTIAAHGIDARTQEAFVLDLIDRGGAPKLAIIEIRPALSTSLQAPAFSTYRPFSERVSDLIAEAQPKTVLWPKLLNAYAFNSPQLANILQKVADRDDQATGPSNGKINETMKKRWLAKPQLPQTSPDQVQALGRTASALQAAGSTVIVLAAPQSPVTRQKGPWMDKVMGNIRAAMPPGVKVLDYSAMLDEDRYFEDPTHMNHAGREAFRRPLDHLIEQTLREASARKVSAPGRARGAVQESRVRDL